MEAPPERERPAERPALPPQPRPDPVGGATLLRLALPFYALVALFAAGYALFSGGLGGLVALFGETRAEPAELLGGLGVGLGLVALTRVGVRGWAPMTRMADALTDLIGPVTRLQALGLAALSGVAEELLFRGALWRDLGLLGTTFLFALVHVLPRRRLWVYPLFALLAGLLIGLVREGTESLWPAIVAHVTVNALNLAWLGARARRRAAETLVS